MFSPPLSMIHWLDKHLDTVLPRFRVPTHIQRRPKNPQDIHHRHNRHSHSLPKIRLEQKGPLVAHLDTHNILQ